MLNFEFRASMSEYFIILHWMFGVRYSKKIVFKIYHYVKLHYQADP